MPAKAARQDNNLFDESLNSETVVRIKRHERDYLMVANKTVQDERLSWETLGLLVYLLSLPADWEIRVRHLQTRGGKWDEAEGENRGTGRDSVRRMLRELQTFGYLSGVGRESQERAQRGRFGQNEIVVYESPTLNPYHAESASPSPENQSTAARPSAVPPSPDSPSPENTTTYKEQNSQKTISTNTHTQQTGLRAVGASAGEGVCVSEEIPLETYERYARNQTPPLGAGWVSKARKTREWDAQVARWCAQNGIDPQAPPAPPAAPVDASKCPDCSGAGWWYPEGFAKGAAKCKHPRMTSVA